MNQLIRKSASLRQTLTALISTAALRTIPATSHIREYYNSGASDEGVNSSLGFGGGGGGRARGFHFSVAPSQFRASLVAPAEYAVDDSSDDHDISSKKKSAGDHGLEISKLGIDQQIVSSLAKKGITTLFPIQRAVLEPAMQGRDMIGRARTGTGKTLAFGIPIMDKIIKFNAKHGQGRNPLALVLAPTRELARQVEKEFCESAPNLDTLVVYGGVPIRNQMSALDYGVDVVVGTPGRIIDLIKRGALDLSEVQFVVLDEADQMLAVGFDEDVEMILDKLSLKRQSMMFSATMPSWIRKLTHKYLKDPLTIDLVGDSDQKLPDGISLYSIVADMYGKSSIIGPLIKEHAKGGKCIVFTQTKRDADRLALCMQAKFRCEALHGDISQSQRERTLAGFRDGQFSILVATDVAARGLDIPNVDLVIHYELPSTSEMFVHRSGRTGRAGKKGNTILIYTDHQNRAVRTIEREVGAKFTELPKIAVEGGNRDMFGDIGGGGRFGSYGGQRGGMESGFGRSGGGGSGFGRSGGYGSASSSRQGGYSESGSYGGQRGGMESGLGRSGGGGSGFGRSGGYGSASSSRQGGYSESGSGRFGSFGGSSSGRSGGGFGSSSSSRSGNINGTRFRRLGGFSSSDLS